MNGGEDMARALVEVTAGVLLGHVDDALTKRWVLTSHEWENFGAPGLAVKMLTAHEYTLTILPQRANWTRIEVVWL